LIQLLLAAIALLAASCGGSESAPPVSEPPPGFPLEVATGLLDDAGRWSLTETGLGSLCLRVAIGDVRRSGCTELSATWLVGILEVGQGDEPARIVYAGLPCGVASAELRQGSKRLDTASTTASDDVAYVVLEAAAGLDGVELVARGPTGSELFRVDRLEDDPSARVPNVGC
jgi:hypothetical protein